MEFTNQQLKEYKKAVKNIPIKQCTQREYRSLIDSLFNSIFIMNAFPTSSTYVIEDHGVRSDS